MTSFADFDILKNENYPMGGIQMLNNAKWITSPDNTEERCYNFYTDFAITKSVKSAVLTATAFGLYTAFINGKRVGNEILTPYWTEYTKRLQYQTYDVTDMLESNTSLSIICAEGWALGRIHAGAEHRNHYCDNISLLFSLESLAIWLFPPSYSENYFCDSLQKPYSCKF